MWRLVTVCVVLIVVPLSVRAESIQWSDVLPDLCNADKGCQRLSWSTSGVNFEDISATITYGARAINVATGEVIACNSSVPQGTQVRFEFLPHEYSHVHWVATGSAHDTPYGDWTAAAGEPAGSACQEKNKVAVTRGEGSNGIISEIYGSLSVAPPEKTIIGLDSCTTLANGSDRLCTLSEPGFVNATFRFAPTIGKMYSSGSILTKPQATALTGFGGVYRGKYSYTIDCSEWDRMGVQNNEQYVLDVPMQSISCPITVLGNTPENPLRSPTTPLLSAGQCVVDSPLTISMQSTDPDNDVIRYGIDWDTDGNVDEFVPGSGYVGSGTVMSAVRIFRITGEKTVRVLAQDDGGMSSSWSNVSFQCTDTPATTAALCSDGLDNDADGLVDMNDAGCLGGGDNDESNSPSSVNPDASLSIRAVPSLVKSGRTTRINWSAENVQSCTVTAPNGDSWNTTDSQVGGEMSRPITGEVFYTLSCIDLDGETQTKSAKVRILPTFQEL